jgi:hypothetical protein
MHYCRSLESLDCVVTDKNQKYWTIRLTFLFGLAASPDPTMHISNSERYLFAGCGFPVAEAIAPKKKPEQWLSINTKR